MGKGFPTFFFKGVSHRFACMRVTFDQILKSNQKRFTLNELDLNALKVKS